MFPETKEMWKNELKCVRGVQQPVRGIVRTPCVPLNGISQRTLGPTQDLYFGVWCSWLTIVHVRHCKDGLRYGFYRLGFIYPVAHGRPSCGTGADSQDSSRRAGHCTRCNTGW